MPLLSLLLLGLLAGDPSMDLLGGRNDLTAWKAGEGTPAVEIAAEAGAAWLKLDAPFARNAKLKRVVIDRSVPLDLSAPGAFCLEVEASDPAACGDWTLYFHSKSGWFAAGAVLNRPGRQTLRFPKSAFRDEEKPLGWEKIDGIRLCAWKGAAKDAQVRIFRLTAQTAPVVIVVPKERGSDDARIAHDCAALFAELLGELGLTADTIEESALPRGALGRRKIAILPYNPRLSTPAIAVLESFVEGGGKVFACYQLPERLSSLLGFSAGVYVRPPRAGHFATMQMDAHGMLGMPASVRQGSWNIVAAKPTGYRARIVGEWCDDAGKPTGHAALLVSDRGALLSHILLADDREHKREMLAAILGTWQEDLWKTMVRGTIGGLDRVGHCRDFAELEKFVAAADPKAPLFAEVKALRGDVLAALDAPGPLSEDVIARAAAARAKAVEVYLRAAPSKSGEVRAAWNHSGLGAYPGDWPRSIRLLKDNGFNKILPNMLWGGLALYPSDVLPRSDVLAKYGDQAAQCCAAARAAGIEVHVWKVNYNLSNAPREFVDRMRRAGRTQQTAAGKPLDWLCPSHPVNRKLELESMLEVARRYPIDGLHFDYIRYPGGESCFCDGCRERFEAESGRKANDWPAECRTGARKEEYGDWRCKQITLLVASVAEEARKLRKGLKISAAVFGAYPDCRASVAQDWPAWVKAGYLDFVCPMDYTHDDEQFAQWIQSQRKLIDGRIPLYPGIGATASRSTLSADRVVGQILRARSLGAEGFTLFEFNADTARSILPGVGLGAGRTVEGRTVTPPPSLSHRMPGTIVGM